MIEWSDKYSVKVEVIDNQHKIFIDLINSLEELTKHDNFLEELPRVSNELVEYTGLHFKTEESLLIKYDYPNFESHHAKHEAIKKEIYLECKRIVEKEPTVLDVIWLYNFMSEWIKTHILKEDMQYVPYLKELHY